VSGSLILSPFNFISSADSACMEVTGFSSQRLVVVILVLRLLLEDILSSYRWPSFMARLPPTQSSDLSNSCTKSSGCFKLPAPSSTGSGTTESLLIITLLVEASQLIPPGSNSADLSSVLVSSCNFPSLFSGTTLTSLLPLRTARMN